MSQTIQILAGEDQYIQGLYSCPEKETIEETKSLLVIMVHNFPGNKAAHGDVLGKISNTISNKSYHTLRFDFRGCGESDGREEDFSLESARADLKTVESWAKDQGYEKFIFIGEGLGAALSVMDAAEDALCYIFLWPVLDLPRMAKYAFKAHEVPDAWEKKGYADINDHRIGLNFINEMNNTDLLPALRAFKNPLMIMHGVKDDVSPAAQLELVRAHVQARRVEITTFHDGTHGLPQENHRRTMLYHIMQFIEKYT